MTALNAPAPAEDLRLYSPDEVATLTGTPALTLRRLAKQGKITSKRGARSALLFSMEDIKSLHAYYAANAASMVRTAEPEEDGTPFNFTSRGKAIHRNKAS